MPFLSIEQFMNISQRTTPEGKARETMVDFLDLVRSLERGSDYTIFQSLDDNFEPTNFCYWIGRKYIISFRFGNQLPGKFEIVPLIGRVKAVNLNEYSINQLNRAMIDITLDTGTISIKTDVSIYDPVARKICFRIAGSPV